MDQASRRSELEKHFGSYPGFSEAFVGQCLEICERYNLTGEDVFYKWEASVLNKEKILKDDTVSDIEALVKSELARIKKREQLNARASGAARGRPGMNPFIGTPLRSSSAIGSVGSPSTSRLAQPQTKSAFSGAPALKKYNVVFALQGEDVEKRSYKYMYEKITERDSALDDRITEFADLAQRAGGGAELGLANESTAGDEEIVVLGRVVMDSDSDSSLKMNETSVILEVARSMGLGARVPLRFDSDLRIRGGPKGRPNFAVFPGSIVALKGKNGGAGVFSVSEFLSIPPPKPLVSSIDQRVKAEPISDSFSMIIASGPFTSDSDLEFKPWRSVMDKVRASQPDVVLFNGPFIDCKHGKIVNGDVDEFPEDIFERVFARDVIDLGSYMPSTLVLIVPSVRDATHGHAVYPQAAFPDRLLDAPNVRMLPNPAHFSLNGVSFGVTSVDSLYHTKKLEFIKSGVEVDPVDVFSDLSAKDVMSNICRQLLSQRSFYPVFPPPVDLAHDVNLDVSHMHLARITIGSGDEAVAPDVLVLPSRYKHFAKSVDDTMAINPSYAVKGVVATVFYGGSGVGPASARLKVELEKL